MRARSQDQSVAVARPSAFAVFEAARNVGLTPVECCVVLLAGHDPGDKHEGGERLIAHGSFFQLKDTRDARLRLLSR